MTANPETSRDRLFALIASIPGSGTVDWCDDARALLDEIAAPAVVSSPPATDRATVLREEAALIRAHCPDHLDSESAEGSWISCHCDVADDMERRGAEAQPETEAETPKRPPMDPVHILGIGAERDDPTQCSGEEGFCPEHGFHRHSLKQPPVGARQPDTETQPAWTSGPVAPARAAEWASQQQAATVDPTMCPRCKGDNQEAFELCASCAAGGADGEEINRG